MEIGLCYLLNNRRLVNDVPDSPPIKPADCHSCKMLVKYELDVEFLLSIPSN